MININVVTGTVIDDRTVTLDESLPTGTKVRVIVESATSQRRPVIEVLEEIWAAQRKRGHVPPTREEVDEYIRQERDSWDK
jgi:hypothetical protein